MTLTPPQVPRQSVVNSPACCDSIRLDSSTSTTFALGFRANQSNMHRSFLILIAVAWAAVRAPAQDLMPPHVASQLGLTQAWLRPINTPFGSQSIVDQQIYVHQSDPQEYVEIVQVTKTPDGEGQYPQCCGS